MKKIVILAAAILALSACNSDDNNNPVVVQGDTQNDSRLSGPLPRVKFNLEEGVIDANKLINCEGYQTGSAMEILADDSINGSISSAIPQESALVVYSDVDGLQGSIEFGNLAYVHPDEAGQGLTAANMNQKQEQCYLFTREKYLFELSSDRKVLTLYAHAPGKSWHLAESILNGNF